LCKVINRPNILQTRGEFCYELYQTENEAYWALRELQKDVIPFYYGSYFAHFPEREWRDDQRIHVTVVENVDGVRLNRLSQRDVAPGLDVRAEIHRILDRMADKGVLRPTVERKHFVVCDAGKKVKAIDFCLSMFTEPPIVTGEAVSYIALQKTSVDNFLDEMGFIAPDEGMARLGIE
jgi:hypothetical protein